MPQAVSTVATLKRTLICAENIPCFNTASGRCCCNGKDYENLYLGFDEFQYRKRQALLQLKMKLVLIIIEKTLVSIPQAVGTVATSANVQPSSVSYSVSIPQAVGTVATSIHQYQQHLYFQFQYRKRQALLQHDLNNGIGKDGKLVSIPQAVGTVATAGSRKPVFMRFQKLVLENLKP